MEPTHGLPKGEEDDKLDGEELEEWALICDILVDLVIELDERVHGKRDGYRLDNSDLCSKLAGVVLVAWKDAHPNVRE